MKRPMTQAMARQSAVFLVDASPTAGLGHLKRCLVLASALTERGLQCRFLLTDPFGLPRTAGHDATLFHAAADSQGDLLIVDGYAFRGDILADLSRHTRKLVLLDDLADNPFPADVILNHNAYGHLVDYSHYGATTVLSGPEYTLIHPSFFALKTVPRAQDRILVAYGGGKTASQGLALGRALADRGWRVDVALGGAVSPPPNIGEKLQYHQNAVMQDLMARSFLFVGGLGVSFLEALAAGMDVVGVQLADNQSLAREWAEHLGLSVFDRPDRGTVLDRIGLPGGVRTHASPAYTLPDGGAMRAANSILLALSSS